MFFGYFLDDILVLKFFFLGGFLEESLLINKR